MKMMMNTILAAALMGSIGTVAVASSETAVNQAAFAKTTTVKQALTMKDDSKVQLKGYVVKAVGDENTSSVIILAPSLSKLMMNFGKVNLYQLKHLW